MGGTTDPSDALALTIDTTAPSGFTNTPPDTAQVGVAYSFDAESSEEGDLAYSLVDAPDGMTIDASTGEIAWTPASDQTVPQSFQIVLTDAAGNATSENVAITVTENSNDLGTVDFLLLPQLDLTGGTLTYSLQTAHNGYLTFEALYSDTTGSVTMTLLDGDGNELAVSSVADGGQRIDWETLADVSYTLKLSGDLSAVDLRIANLLHLEGTVVTVYGTAEADTFLFSAETGRNVTINGVLYAFGNDEVSEVVFDADKTDTDTGSDVVWIEGSDLAETLTATFEGEELVPTMIFQTNEGAAQPFIVTATNFEQLLAWSRSGEADTAVFQDSPGQDKAKALPGEDAALIRSKSGYATFYRRAKLFEEVTFVGASSPDDDTVVFFDTSGSDLFEANGETGEHTLTAESGLVATASGFSELLVRSIYDGDTDTATFVDSSRNDKFVGRPAKARLYSLIEGYEYDIVVRDFDVADVDFSNGGTDVARLTDSARSDQFVAAPTECTFNAASYTFTVKQADMVTVTSHNADDGDTAEIHDTDGDDVLQAGYDNENAPTAELWTPDKDGDLLFQLAGIESIDAYGTTGTNRAHIAGTDFVQLYGLWDESSVAEVQDDAYEVDEDGELTIDAALGVLANDSDTDGDALTATVVTQPSHGALALNTDGSFIYVPETDFHGTDTFTYVANDGTSDSGEATVTIDVLEQ